VIFSHLTALTATHRFIHDVSDHVRVFESVLFFTCAQVFLCVWPYGYYLLDFMTFTVLKRE